MIMENLINKYYIFEQTGFKKKEEEEEEEEEDEIFSKRSLDKKEYLIQK
jgi:hypothetical protein